MKDSGFLIFNERGIVGFKKGRVGPSYMSKYKSPALAAGERAVFITVDVPDTVFQPKPTPSATIVIPEDKVMTPAVDVIIENPPEMDND
jgi:hypothetical protein